jgi:hypothetical protein
MRSWEAPEMTIFMTRPFARFARKAGLTDRALLQAASAVIRGECDADLGGSLFKQRVARSGEGKSGGFRTILVFRDGSHVFFVHGFAKSKKANVDDATLRALKRFADVLLGYSGKELSEIVADGRLIEIGSHDGEGEKAG